MYCIQISMGDLQDPKMEGTVPYKAIIEWASAQVPPTPSIWGALWGEREREGEGEGEMDGWMDR